MPTEVPLPILTSNALNDEKDGNTSHEEKPVSHIGNNRYDALGISNEAVHYEKLGASIEIFILSVLLFFFFFNSFFFVQFANRTVLINHR